MKLLDESMTLDILLEPFRNDGIQIGDIIKCGNHYGFVDYVVLDHTVEEITEVSVFFDFASKVSVQVEAERIDRL